jgi:hypothetical protein
MAILLLAASLLLAANATGSDDMEDYRKFIRDVSREISSLKGKYSQLQEFSMEENTDLEHLRITYGFRTHRSDRSGGWVSGVPNPDPDGIWFYIDLHDPDSTAQIHTQPFPGPPLVFGNKIVSFLILEGDETQSIRDDIFSIIKRHGAEPILY